MESSDSQKHDAIPKKFGTTNLKFCVKWIERIVWVDLLNNNPFDRKQGACGSVQGPGYILFLTLRIAELQLQKLQNNCQNVM